MRSKTLAVLGTLALVLSVMGGALSVQAAPSLPDYRPADAGPRLRGMGVGEIPLRVEGLEAMAAASAQSGGPDFYLEGDTRHALWYDDLSGLYVMTYTVAAVGEHIEVWVAHDLDFPEGDPRNPVVITQEQIDYVVEEFDTNIYPNMVSFFGMADFHNGANAALDDILGLPSDYYMADDGEDRVVAMISNIGDENYYDPDYPLYIAGFYWGSVFEYYLDRNVISIDAYDWANRTGPDSERPYLYEGVFAHEYQHLLHDDYDPAEENWINEGLSDWAEGLCGYGIPDSHVEDLAELPENSLVAWGDQGDLELLADYGIAYMYQEYMYEHYGQSFIQSVFQDSAHQGIASVDSVLAGLGATETFADTYHDFAAALYTTGAFTREELVDFQVNVGHPGKPNPEAFATPGAPPWGADYHLLWGYERIANFRFNGYEFNPLSWTTDGDVLWSGTGDLIDNWAIFETAGGGTLTFDTYYEIEAEWDFGFVQVSTDGGYTWTSLENAYTTDAHAADAHPKVIENLPGLTGSSGGWITMSFDLSAYAGQDIMIGFRYVTDWATTEEGWYIDNVTVDGTLISDGSSTDAFVSLNQLLGISNDYTVLLIGERVRRNVPEYEVMTVMSGGYVSDWYSIRDMFDRYRRLVMVVIYDAPQGVSSYADYTFEIDHRGDMH